MAKHKITLKGIFMSYQDAFDLWMRGSMVDYIDGYEIENEINYLKTYLIEEGDEVEIEIDSIGGDYKHGWIARYAVQELNKKVKVNIVAVGDVGSSASMFYMSVPITQRIVRKGATGFIHNPAIQAGGDAVEHEKIAQILRDTEEEMSQQYANDMNISLEQAKKYMDESTLFSPKKMIESGFAGKMHEDDLEVEYNIAAIWSKSCVTGKCNIESKQNKENQFKEFINQL